MLIWIESHRSSYPEVFLWKSVLKICSKFTRENPCRNVISIKLLCNFIEIALRHGFSSVNLLHIFRTPFHKSTSGQLLLKSEMLKIYHHFHSLPLFLRLKAWSKKLLQYLQQYNKSEHGTVVRVPWSEPVIFECP